MKIQNKTKNTMIANNVEIADTMATRMRGLLGRGSLSSGEALIITRCQSIHMFFMKFAIDVIFVDKNNVVVGLVERINPWALSPIFFKASKAIELAEGMIEKTKTKLGDLLEIY